MKKKIKNQAWYTITVKEMEDLRYQIDSLLIQERELQYEIDEYEERRFQYELNKGKE